METDQPSNSESFNTDLSVSNNQVIDLTSETFIQEVIEKSKSIPVIVDFWAPWCEPCKQIAPILERLVSSEDGRVILTKLNIDDNPEIAQQLQIQSIPAILGFHNGQPVDGFAGVQPESSIKAFVQKLASLNGPSENEIAMEEGRELFENKNYNEALEIFGKVAQSEPDNISALSMIANCYLGIGETDIATEIISNIEGEGKEKNQEYLSAKSQIDILSKAQEKGIDENKLNDLIEIVDKEPNNHQARFDIAINSMANNNHEEAIKNLLYIIEKDRSWNDEAARKSLLEIFSALGPNHDLVVDGRKKLSSILFS